MAAIYFAELKNQAEACESYHWVLECNNITNDQDFRKNIHL